jgi:hypothetical protein
MIADADVAVALDLEQQLTDDILLYEHDPIGYVLYVFPWGEPGTSLADETGPDAWQRDVLEALGRASTSTSTAEEMAAAIQIAVKSGHGIGKTALVSWIIHWFISTRPHPQIVVTANTKNQLDTKTWRELAKWNNLAINGHWFRHTATRFFAVDHPETWFAAAIPWSEHNSDAFAGTHDKNVLVIFDEASAIADIIWEVASGAMTTPGAIWAVFGNPTLNRGRFHDCFGAQQHRWITYTVDSRGAKMANKAQIQKWIDDYGEDSDFVRVRVRGEFPRASSMQFIGQDLVDAAKVRVVQSQDYEFAPIVIGVDPARYGDDRSVIVIRQGLKLHDIRVFREVDTMQLASFVVESWDRWKADTVFVDEVGVGAGVVDRLRQIGKNPVGINGGAKPIEKKHVNKRAEMWDNMREWLRSGASIPDNRELITDLTTPEYGYTSTDALQMEKKEDMKSRGMASPDLADALALTFALPVTAKNTNTTIPGAVPYNFGESQAGAWMR